MASEGQCRRRTKGGGGGVGQNARRISYNTGWLRVKDKDLKLSEGTVRGGEAQVPSPTNSQLRKLAVVNWEKIRVKFEKRNASQKESRGWTKEGWKD